METRRAYRTGDRRLQSCVQGGVETDTDGAEAESYWPELIRRLGIVAHDMTLVRGLGGRLKTGETVNERECL